MGPLSLLQAIQNPQAFIMNVKNNSRFMQNPLARNAMNMLESGDSKGLEEMANNLCKQNGTSVEEVKKIVMGNLGIN